MLPHDQHKAWAFDFVGKSMKSLNAKCPPPLRTIALGALTWSDVWMGGSYYHNSHYRSKKLYSFLQLRTYRIKYLFDLQGVCSPVLSLVAQGYPRDLEGFSSSFDVLKPYW